MPLPLPSTFYPELTNDRLTDIANELLDLRHETLSALSSEWDDAYTKESAVFGRCRNRLIGLCEERDWLSVSNPGMDVTLCIGNKVPFRFFRDDPENPQKRGFFKQRRTDDLFPVDLVTPVMWRFIIERAMTEEDEDRVYFAGFNELQDKVSLWEHKPGVTSPYSVGDAVPKSKQLPPAAVQVRGDKDNVDASKKSSPDEPQAGQRE
jgi:hypothetical protein